MTQQLANFLGSFYMILGISLFLQPAFWKRYAEQLRKKPHPVVVLGIINVLLGLFVVLNHPEWSMRLDVLVTLVGWIMLVKGVMLLWFPNAMLKMVPVSQYTPLYTRFQAVFVVILGALMVYSV